MSRTTRHRLFFALQSLCIALSLTLAWTLRLDYAAPPLAALLRAAFLLVAVRTAVLYRYRLTSGYWRYTGEGDLLELAKAIAIGSAAFFVLQRLVLGVRAFPLSLYLIEPMITFLSLLAARMLARWWQQVRLRRTLGVAKPVLIIGAGSAGTLLVEAMKQMAYKPIGFVDDDIKKQRMRICGVPVLGRMQDLVTLTARNQVAEILIAIPSASALATLRITDACRKTGIPFRTVPSLAQLAGGKIQISELQDFRIEELLGREPVSTQPELVDQALEGSIVMVTGAAGSIGSEICRQLARKRLRKLICVDQAETPLFHLQQQMHNLANAELVYCVTDVADTDRMRSLLSQHRVQTVFHAAAYKHVPMMEANPYEGLQNNVFALWDLVAAAEETGCNDFILISTDKAVNPSSFMGCTKRIGEMIVSSRPSRMRCVSVRFGNVLGSQGSVVPTFQQQILTTGEVTVTHPEMTRYFMTIPEACSLVLQAFTVGSHRDVLVLDMGEPIRIVDLARTLARAMGKADRELKIRYTGVRPGEKLFEDLFYEHERVVPTSCPKVLRAQAEVLPWELLESNLHELRTGAEFLSRDAVCAQIQRLIPQYSWTPAYAMPAPDEAEAASALPNPARSPAPTPYRFAALTKRPA